MAGNNINAAGTWICKCGKTNTGKFCVKCGNPRPAAPAPQPVSPTEWMCACGKTNTGQFCVKCGNPRSSSDSGNASRSANGAVVMPPRGNNPAVGTATMPPRNNKLAAEEAAARKAAEEAAARKAAEEAAARKAAEEAAARKATEEAAARKVVEAQEASPTPSAETDGNKGMLTKAAIGVAVLLLLIGAYLMFGGKKEASPAPEPQKVETKAEIKTETKEEKKTDTEKPIDPVVREAKLKEYAEAMKKANAQKKQDAAATEKIVFLAEDVQRKDNDLIISGHFYNGKKNRTIISVKALELDIVLRDVDKELMNEKNIKYEKAFTGMNIKPLKDSEQLTVTLPGKAPAGEFNNFTVTAHDVHWEGVGD